jgi:DNA-binding transcriptional regulator YhcF (GntR family)
MDIHISKESEVPLRQQVAEQIIFQIVTEKLKPGETLPSVRELARRLKIHHNTISHAYQDLAQRHWVVSKRGSHLVVIREHPSLTRPEPKRDLDDLINLTIESARQQGYSLQALRERVRARLLTQPPDHILVVEEERGLRELLQEEIREAMRWPVTGCSRQELAGEPGLAVGALVATPQYATGDTEPLVPKDRPAVPIAFCEAEDYVAMIRRLRDPSVIAVVSVSALTLQAAQGFMAPAIGRRHTFTQLLLPLENAGALRGADLIFCDTIALRHVKSAKRVHYRLASPASIEYLSNAMDSYQQPRQSRYE